MFLEIDVLFASEGFLQHLNDYFNIIIIKYKKKKKTTVQFYIFKAIFQTILKRIYKLFLIKIQEKLNWFII